MDYNMKHISAFMLILLSALLGSCGGHSEGGSNSERFDWALQGIWEKTNPEIWDYPVPRMIIGYRGITIIGEIEHFGNLPREIELEGYSDKEENLIYIKAREEIFSVKYKTWEAGNYPKTRMLTLKGLEDIDFKFVIEENE
jgi:hypothetical protein